MLEKVQRHVTHMVSSLRNLPDEERLRALGLPSLCYRRKRGDMILVYQIFRLIDVNPSIFFSPALIDITRGHSYKIFKPHTGCSSRLHFFSNRVINDWNNLPYTVINVPTISSSKSLLADEH